MIRAFLARVEEDHDVGEAGCDGLRNLSTVDVEVVVEAGHGRRRFGGARPWPVQRERAEQEEVMDRYRRSWCGTRPVQATRSRYREAGAGAS